MKNSLFFEFKDRSGKVNPIFFSEPEEIIMARTIEEVRPCLDRVQALVESGMYAAGYITYEAAPAFDESFIVHKENRLPLLWFGIFRGPSEPPLAQRTKSFSVSEWVPNTSFEEYESEIKKIKQAIEVGDTYQVNYTIRLQAQFEGDDFAFYKQLSRGQSANYCAYVSTEEHSILSASPELFFHLEDGRITTKPMKGTIGRGKSTFEDRENKEWLASSSKNRSENLMIVDLLRNDLGQIAKIGSVHVPSLFTIEEYPTVFQMTSTVTAQTAPKTTIADLFSALFPCGSITGAPKVSTMKIIGEIESTPREVYCGAIGYITPEMEAIFNVPIRTVMIEKSTKKAEYGVGGGITWDSTVKEEYEEVMTKAMLLKQNRPKFELLESLLLKDGQYFLLDKHLERLQKSVDYFRFTINPTDVLKKLEEHAQEQGEMEEKVRLLVGEKGTICVEGAPLHRMPDEIKACLSSVPIVKDEIFLYHKTTNRYMYDRAREGLTGVHEVLLWNDEGELTEFCNGNVVLELGGKLLTPPVECGLLAGTFRQYLIETNQIQESKLTLADIEESTSIWLINSVRKWVKVNLIE